MRERPAVLWFLAGLATIGLLIAFADRPVNAWVAGLDGPFIDSLRAITQIGNSRWYLFGLPVVIAVSMWLRRRAGGLAALRLDAVAGGAAYLFAAVAVSGIATNVIKLPLGRARPKIWDESGVFGLSPFSLDHDFQGFPSGHATTLFALAAALGCLAPRLRWPLYGLAALLSFSRVAVNAHYPSDLVGGAMVGIAAALLLRHLLARHGLLFPEEAQTLNAAR
jgi:undecaprenyl-diphosphatase